MYGCGRVESSTTWQDLQFDPSEELVAVVNPSRGGLGMNFIFHRVAADYHAGKTENML